MLSLKKAGDILRQYDIQADEATEAVSRIQEWRKTFEPPTQTIYVSLIRAAKKVDITASTARRLKKIQSIQYKLRRNEKMQLPTMQDIGGCRAVLSSVENVRTLSDLMEKSKSKRKLIKKVDYIDTPKKSGYRGIHLIFSQPTLIGSELVDKKIEVQIRTNLQHIWATAVELAELATNYKLKSGEGTDEWKRFFAIASSAFALQEESPLVPNTPTTMDEIVTELQALDKAHHFITRLQALRHFKQVLENLDIFTELSTKDKHFILSIDAEKKSYRVESYKKYADAYKAYTEKERLENGVDSVVLVSVESYNKLQKMYPNYFADIREFLGILETLMET